MSTTQHIERIERRLAETIAILEAGVPVENIFAEFGLDGTPKTLTAAQVAAENLRGILNLVHGLREVPAEDAQY